MEMWKLLSQIEEIAKGLHSGAASCHDWDHTLRVRQRALELCRQLPDADTAVVKAAVLLHDIGRGEEVASGGKVDHAKLGAEKAQIILNDLNCYPNFICKVCDCIRTHRYRKRKPGEKPVTLEAQIVYDADKLDSLGAVGIARSFHFASKLDARIHNTREQALASDSYSREDTAYREYLVKLQYLPQAMLTEPGRARGKQLLDFMTQFFDELTAECQ